MNASDMRTPPSDFGLLAIHPFHAFALATLGGVGVYLSFFRSSRDASSILLPSVEASADATERPLEKDLSRPDIQPLRRIQPAPKLRPYNDQFQLAPTSPNDLILIDSSYRSRLAYRRHLLTAYPSTTYGYLPTATYAVAELYNYLFCHHLPSRFPMHFSLSPSGTLVQNHTTGNTYPIVAQSSKTALKAIGENLDEDFIILHPNGEIAAFVVAFFNMPDKLGNRPAASGFDHLLPGVEHAITRHNWSVVKSAEVRLDAAMEEEGTPETAALRVERQTLWKLPGSGAVILGVKTYITPLKEIKKEDGEAIRLADALEKMDNEGFKAVCEYLRC